MRAAPFTLIPLAGLALFLAIPALAQGAPSQSQLDSWTEDVVRYCTPEIRRFIRVGLVDAQRRVAEQNRNRNGGVEWVYRERTERVNLRSTIEQSLVWAVEMPSYAPDIDQIGTGRGEIEGVGDRRIGGRVAPAVRKRIGRDVQNPHHRRAAGEIEGPGSELPAHRENLADRVRDP